MLRAYGDGTLFGEAFGPGPAAVLWLHGWGRRGADFAVAAAQLADAGVSSVALDLPGFGASPPPPHAGGARLYAEVLERAMPSLAPGPVVLVGHSFGGRVATVVAARKPDLVRALVLTGTPLVRLAASSRPAWRYRVARALHARGILTEDRMEAARQRHGSADYRAARGVMRAVLVASVGESYEEEMAAVRAPVRLLWGAQDTEVPVAVAEAVRGIFPGGAALRVLDGVGHFVPTEAPGDLAREVTEALA